MTKFLRIPTEIEAVRYGDVKTGAWSDVAVTKIVTFLLDDDTVNPVTVMTERVNLRVANVWDPPVHCELEIYDGVAHGRWLPLQLGDWLIKGIKGEFYPCKNDIFLETYGEMKNLAPILFKHTLISQTLEEIDRNARAYGWEIGRGQNIDQKIEASGNNPFMDKNWRYNAG